MIDCTPKGLKIEFLSGRNSANKPIELTNKNILSKKALNQLNHTQKIFPYHKMSATKKSVDLESVNTSLSAGKTRKIGGIARRRVAKESVRNLLDMKKNLSIRELSLNSANSPSPNRQITKHDLDLTTSLAQMEIQVTITPEVGEVKKDAKSPKVGFE